MNLAGEGKLIHARDESTQGPPVDDGFPYHEEKSWRDQLTEAVLALETKLARFQGER